MEYFFQHFDIILLHILATLYFLICVPILAGLWRIFEKGGYSGIWSFVPVANLIVVHRMAGCKWRYLFLFLVPGAQLVFFVVWAFRLAKRMGASYIFGFGLLFFPYVYLPTLGFGNYHFTTAETNSFEDEEVYSDLEG